MDRKRYFFNALKWPKTSVKWFVAGLCIGVIGAMFVAFGGPDCTAANEVNSGEAYALPYAEKNLPVIKAQPWVQVDRSEAVLIEGPAFDRKGNLFVSSIFDSRILKISPDKKITTIFQHEGLLPDGIAIHKDGRLFVACLNGSVA